MSASERLKAWDQHLKPPPPEPRSAAQEDVAFWELRCSLPQILAVVEAAEAVVKIDATSSYTSIYSAPTEMAGPCRQALLALEAALK